MLKYFVRRVLLLLPKVIVISLLIFFALQLLPGDPISRTLPPEEYSDMTDVQLNLLREKLGLNDPIFIQYFHWTGRMVRGDFGYSQATGADISMMLQTRLPATMEIALIALIIATVLGLLFGFIAAIKQNTWIDYFNTTLSIIGVSVPQFFFGLIAILVFSLWLGWLPTGGRMSYGESDFIQRLPYMIMPSLCLGISLIATLMRFTRSAMLDVLNREYIKTARSKGMGEISVNVKHGLRNAMIPVMVLLVFRLPILVSGTVVIENVFNYPGMGSMLIDALAASDMPVVMITTMIISIVMLLASCIVDIFTALLDPRIKFGET